MNYVNMFQKTILNFIDFSVHKIDVMLIMPHIGINVLKHVPTFFDAAYFQQKWCWPKYDLLRHFFVLFFSGSEEQWGHLWDRHHQCHLAKLDHQAIVNCVSFNPQDNEMLVSVSDDKSIKIWRSRNRLKELGKENAHY